MFQLILGLQQMLGIQIRIFKAEMTNQPSQFSQNRGVSLGHDAFSVKPGTVPSEPG